jgi:hypothetical protein
VLRRSVGSSDGGGALLLALPAALAALGGITGWTNEVEAVSTVFEHFDTLIDLALPSTTVMSDREPLRLTARPKTVSSARKERTGASNKKAAVAQQQNSR